MFSLKNGYFEVLKIVLIATSNYYPASEELNSQGAGAGVISSQSG